MRKQIQIAIPQPCHEKWDEMTPTDKGKFCAACQKNVIDFTKASDREIANAIRNNKNLCGRFSTSQLDRDLVVTKEKNTLWTAVAAGVLSFVTLGSYKVSAQEKIKTEQTDSSKTDSIPSPEKWLITGTVSDEMGPMPGANIINLSRSTDTLSDLEGKFEMTVFKGDVIEIQYVGYQTYSFKAEKKEYDILINESTFLDSECLIKDVYGRPNIKKRTFFGRVFHSIGNIFR